LNPGEGVIRADIAGGDISKFTQKAASFSWMIFLKENFTIQVLGFSLFFGSFLNFVRGKAKMISGMQQAEHWVFKGLKFVMYLAPLGALGGMAYTIGKFGIHSLLPLAKLMVSVYATMGIFIFVILALIMRSCGERITSFLNYIKEELLIVLGTSSSEAALPSLMKKLEAMGCSKSVVGLVVPAGYSFNLDGTSIYLSMATLFLAQVYGIDLSIEQMLTIIGVLMVTSKGAAGVTGSGFVVLASTLTALQVIPLEGLALLLGVDRFMSEARAITNFIGNGVATIWLAKHEGEFHQPEA
jgi:aerobic C4-dicarboxylate transport protein